MTTRLDEIERTAMLAAMKDRVFLSRDDILALVAVARAGIALRDSLADRQDLIPEHLYRAEKEHTAALAPLLAPVGEHHGEGSAL
jgi:hypothetical protein